MQSNSLKFRLYFSLLCLFSGTLINGQALDFTAAACATSHSITVTVTSGGAGAPYTYNLSGCGAAINQPGQPGIYTFSGIPQNGCFTNITVTDNAGTAVTKNVFMPNINFPGVARVYSYPCGLGTYVVIPIGGLGTGSNATYTLYASDGITVIAGPQSSNVFPGVVGNAGDNFVAGVRRNCGGESTSPFSLGTSTTITSRIDCACTLGVPMVCSGVSTVDLITGATYTWTSPNGTIYTGPELIVPGIAANNGIWQLVVSITTPGCTYSLNNSIAFINCETLVPVKFKEVTVNSKNCKLTASWSTANEDHTDRYEVETSADEIGNWQTVAIIKTTMQTGSDKEYKTLLPWTASGKVYMRIKVVDKDGRFNYSKIVMTEINCKSRMLQLDLMPNPVQQNGSIVVRISGEKSNGQSTIVFTDIMGRQSFSKTVFVTAATVQFDIPVSYLAKGVYLVKIAKPELGLETKGVKLVIQ